MKSFQKNLILIFLPTLIFLISSCSGGKRDDDYYDRAYPVQVGMNYNGGFFYSDSKESMIKLFDYESRTFAPLCAVPNCLHNNSECTAVRKYGDTLFLYHNKLYSIHSEVEAVDAAASIGRVMTAITVSDADGMNEQEFVKFDGEWSEGYRSYIYNGCLYFASKLYKDIDISNEWSHGSSDYSTCKLFKLDLTSGKITETATLAEGYRCNADIICMTVHKAYIFTIYTEEEAKYEDYDSVEEWMEAVGKIEAINNNIAVDLETGEITEEQPPIDIQFIYDSHYYCTDNGIYVYNPDTENFDLAFEKSGCIDVIDDRYLMLLNGEEVLLYDSKTDKTTPLPDYTNVESFFPEVFYGDYCFGSIQMSSETENYRIFGYGYCKTDDMFKEDCEFTVVYSSEIQISD